MSRIAGIVLVSLVGLASTAQAPRVLQPVDEAAKVPSFLAFRNSLIAIVKARDAKKLEAVIAPNIKLSFGGDEGLNDFRKMWQPVRPDSKLWPELATILRLGGSFKGLDHFYAPYVYSNFPNDLDAFETGVIIDRNVPLRSKPTLGAPVIARLTYEIVEAETGTAATRGWVKVTRKVKPTTGYVEARSVRSPVDYRAGFERIKGKWMMTLLVAGD